MGVPSLHHRRLALLGWHLSPAPAAAAAQLEVKKNPQHTTLGAEVLIDLADPSTFSQETRQALRKAIADHGVLNIRTGDEPLDRPTFRKVCELLGPIKNGEDEGKNEAAKAPVKYQPDFLNQNFGKVAKDPKTGQERRFLPEFYHTDDSYTTRPARYTCLHPQELPASGGGGTGFLDMRWAFRSLPEELKEEAKKHKGVHAFNNHGLFTGQMIDAEGKSPGNALAEGIWPLVRLVPETGEKALYLNLDRMTGIEGMEQAAAVSFLRKLQEHAEKSVPEHTHNWRHGDVVIWDNAVVQHHGHNDWAMGEPRRHFRVLIQSDKTPEGP